MKIIKTAKLTKKQQQMGDNQANISSQAIRMYSNWMSGATREQIAFVDSVYAFCEKNYGKGGDVIVETFTPTEILGQFKSINDVTEYIGLHNEQKLNARWGEDNDPELQLQDDDDAHYTGRSKVGNFDVDGVKIGDDQWYFYVDGDAMKMQSPIDEVIVSARKWDQEFPDGSSAVQELNKNPGYDEFSLWDIFNEELASFEDERRTDNYEKKNRIGPYDDMEEPDYGPDAANPEY